MRYALRFCAPVLIILLVSSIANFKGGLRGGVVYSIFGVVYIVEFGMKK